MAETVIRSKPLGPRARYCVTCVNSLWVEIGWPAGYWEWARDEHGGLSLDGILVAHIESPVSAEALARAESFFHEPPAPDDPRGRHDHRAAFRLRAKESIARIQSDINKLLSNVSRSDERGEWLSLDEIRSMLSEVKGAIDLAPDSKRQVGKTHICPSSPETPRE